MIARAVYRILLYAAYGVAKVYWRLEVVGFERIPSSGAMVVAPVHRSNVDFIIPALGLRRPIRWMAKSSVFVGGPVDTFLSAMGAFPVERDTTDFAAIRTCESLLRGGHPVVMFPEGRRRKGDIVEGIYDGPAFMAARQRVPILPMGIGGADRAMPFDSKFVFPRKVVIVIGEPIYPDVELDGRVPRARVSELTAELRQQLQTVYDDARRRAGG